MAAKSLSEAIAEVTAILRVSLKPSVDAYLHLLHQQRAAMHQDRQTSAPNPTNGSNRAPY